MKESGNKQLTKPLTPPDYGQLQVITISDGSDNSETDGQSTMKAASPIAILSQ